MDPISSGDYRTEVKITRIGAGKTQHSDERVFEEVRKREVIEKENGGTR